MGLEGSDEGKDESFASHFGARAQFDLNLSPYFAIRATPAGDFYTARLQEKNKSDDYASKVSVDDSYLQFMPVDWVEVRAGALSQRFLDEPLLVSRGLAFPGGMEMFHFDLPSNVKLDLVAQQVIPTSRSLNAERQEREPIPVFQTQSAHLRYQPFEEWNFTLWGGHYSWVNMPSKVAFDSQIIGNQPSAAEDPASAHFQYGFDGYFGGFRGCYCVNDNFSLEIGYTQFANLEAPAVRRNGQMVELSPSYDQKFWNLKLTGSYFFVESDATPALYTQARYGNNNRVGTSVEARLLLKKYGFSILGQYVDANTINYDPNQQRLMTMLFGVETNYAPF